MFSVSSEQANKLGLGRNQTISIETDLYQLVNFNFSPLLVTLVADKSANTGNS
ncbi:hypothetical protein BKA69DRAFT_1047839 [Paraphysoderma sedebokerense]|nr:hypothetical protein BKA69DRAFT_1047783 [Paraphysoderma sedebokerense]KAI9145477.1 hypothetical protein BKA69DRAFT_1047839 [Paraphysoderma sedebokerense]